MSCFPSKHILFFSRILIKDKSSTIGKEHMMRENKNKNRLKYKLTVTFLCFPLFNLILLYILKISLNSKRYATVKIYFVLAHMGWISILM